MNKLNWEEYFLSLVKITALRSKDPNTQVGAVIVNTKNRIIATGYNGMPQGDDNLPWERESNEVKNTKYPYVIHAEVNAILNSTKSIEQATVYTTLFPCSSCAKLLAHSRINKIIYIEDKYNNTEDNIIAKKILDNFNIPYTEGKINNVKIIFD